MITESSRFSSLPTSMYSSRMMLSTSADSPCDADLDVGAEDLLRLLGDQHGGVERAQLVGQRGHEADRALGERGALAEAVDAVDHDALDLRCGHR